MQEKEETTAKLPCELVEDLLPLYIEDLTNPVTNELVEKHLRVCGECKQNYTKMKKPMPEEEIPDAKEIDFLKKTKKQNRKRVIRFTSAGRPRRHPVSGMWGSRSQRA